MRTPISVRRPRLILALAVLGMALAGLFGADVQDSLIPGGFDDPGSESAAAAEILTEEFDAGAPDLVLLITGANGSVDDPAVAGPATQLTTELAARDDVAQAVSYWTMGNAPPLRSTAATGRLSSSGSTAMRTPGSSWRASCARTWRSPPPTTRSPSAG